MKNKALKALALGLTMTTLMMMGTVPTFAEEETETAADAEGEDAAATEGEDAEAEEGAEAEGEDAEAEEGEEAEGEDAEAEDDTAEAEEHAATGTAPETPGEVYEPSVDPEAPKDQAIMVVSFGTSFNDNRKETICAVEDAIVEAFPDYDVRRAFTAQIIIDKVAKYDDVIIDNVGEALDRAVEDGVKTLIVQPTHLMNGLEYDDLVAELAEYSDAFDKIEVGEPLLTSDADFEAVAQAITAATKDYDDGETAICFMGHGTEAESNQVYSKMQDVLRADGYDNYFVGTVEATPTLEDVLAAVQENEAYTKVALQPLMVVAGDHANNDMAGDEEGTWKSEFTAAGYEVTPLLNGLGSLEDVQKLYVEHTQAAIDKASGEAEDAAEEETEASDEEAEDAAETTDETETADETADEAETTEEAAEE
ncbi:MAG: sirohydrochlorin cobaltochelatase [Eubacteriales bacterium]|nr:sirohydrochlorin cobaltochelatase [Eubacteriales bacterium]